MLCENNTCTSLRVDQLLCQLLPTVKFQNFRMPENVAAIYLKFKKRGQTFGYFIKKMQMEGQTVKTLIRLLLVEQSDLGLHCLPKTYLSEKFGSLRQFGETHQS